jgi:Fe-S-cluster containining protein
MDQSPKNPREIAILLLKATAMPDEQVYAEIFNAKYTSIDYYRMACHHLFHCHQCATCCITGDPIRLRREDVTRLAKHLKIPVDKALKKYTIPDPDRPDVYNFKHIKPCKFYDSKTKGCKVYGVRPWSCHIFPFLGIYGSEDQIKVNESCPGSVETMKVLTLALEEAGKDLLTSNARDLEEIRKAKDLLRTVLDAI